VAKIGECGCFAVVAVGETDREARREVEIDDRRRDGRYHRWFRVLVI